MVPRLTDLPWKAEFVASGCPGLYHEKHERFCPSYCNGLHPPLLDGAEHGPGELAAMAGGHHLV